MSKETKTKEEAKAIVEVPEKMPYEIEHGNAYLGAGRPSKAQQLKNYKKALASLDDHIMEALDNLYELMYDDDKYVRLRAIEIVIKKVIPDKKIKEIVGADGGPVQINQNIDVRALVLDAVEALDSIDLKELQERSISGSTKILESDS